MFADTYGEDLRISDQIVFDKEDGSYQSLPWRHDRHVVARISSSRPITIPILRPPRRTQARISTMLAL